MCGICGFSSARNQTINSRNLARHLLLGIEERGRHATGVAWNNGGETWLCSAAIPANEFVADLPLLGSTGTFIGHTRWATQGSPANNDNNHPIDVGGIVGVHNGVIFNDDDLFDRIGAEKRIAQVDSEAIFAYLLHSGLPTVEALTHLQGSAAVAWYEEKEPEVLHLARVSSSPLVVATTLCGSTMFASTEHCLTKSATAMGVALVDVESVPEGTYLQVVEGQVETRQTFATETRHLSSIERQALNV